MLPFTTTVMTVYVFSFCNLSHPFISPALNFFFTEDLPLFNRLVIEYNFSDKTTTDF